MPNRIPFGKRLVDLTLAAGLAALGLTAQPGGASAQQLIKIDGSSTVFPITEAMAEEFQIAHRGTYRVTVGISGSGGGFKKFCRGVTHISDASRPIQASERRACAENGISYIELPVGLDALTVVIHPGNDWAETMTVEQLRTLWEPAAQGEITRWSQVNPDWPDREINLYGPGVDSGTYDYFTEAVIGGEGSSRGDYTASEDDNVLVQGVANDPDALGFFGLAYYAENTDKLKAVAIRNPETGEAVRPSVETARNGTYQPLARPLFIYVSESAADEMEGVREFVAFYLDPANAKLLVREVGYVPLPEEAYRLAMENFRDRVTGTAFADGAQVGVSIEDLLRAERQQ